MSKTLIITGGAGNLGRAVVDQLLKDGFSLEATAIKEGEFNPKPGLRPTILDLTDEKAVQEFVEQVTQRNGSIQGAVMLAGGFAMGDWSNTDVAALDKMFKLNFITAYNLSRQVVQALTKQGKGGQLVLVGARPALQPGNGTGMIAYTLSKSLIFRLAELINAWGADHSITASVIVPSIIDTPLNRAAMPKADPQDWVPPQRIAESISYLLSDAGKMLRETVLKVYNRT